MKYYFVGIKGSGMTSLASILKDLGNDVKGSDVSKSFFTDQILQSKDISFESFESEIDLDTDQIILGNVHNFDHPQVIDAQSKDIDVIRYYDKLNELMQTKQSIAISGTNGKTTTTSLLSQALTHKQPTYLVGDGHGFGNKDSNLFIFEACEYKETFLNYTPDILIINNIEMDHPDFFKNLEDVISLFQKFANKANKLFINMDDENSLQIKENNNNIYYFSLKNKEANLYLEVLDTNKDGVNFNLYYNQELLGNYSSPLYGEYMLYNAMSCILVGLTLNEDIDTLIKNISSFKGAKRRFEEYKLSDSTILIDDYAHHPTAIELTIKAIRQKYPDYKIYTIFQAHTYSRVIEFKDEFINTLNTSDFVYVIDIFGSVREQNSKVSSKVLIEGIDKNKVFDNLNFINKDEKKVIALLGAGDIDKIYIPQIKQLFGEL